MSAVLAGNRMPAARAAVPDAADPAPGAAGVRLDGIARVLPSQDGPRTVLRGLDLDLAPWGVHAVVGPSGCGKSTLLRLVAGRDTPTAGSVSTRGAHGGTPRTAVAFR